MLLLLRNELSTVQQAFGSNLANELIKTYEGSNLVSDSQQDLVGDKYLAEQIRMIQEQQKTTSILDKWGHLLYEGERDYKSSTSAGVGGGANCVSTGSKTSINAQSIGGGTASMGTTGGYINTYSNGSIAHYNQLIEQHQQAQQQAQQEQEQQEQQEQQLQQQQQEIVQQYQEQLEKVNLLFKDS